MHEGIRFACDIENCDYKATHRFSLENHKKSQHEGVKYYCDFKNCEYKCTQKSNLKNHKTLRHEEKDTNQIIECTKCKITFTARKSLKRHRQRVGCNP